MGKKREEIIHSFILEHLYCDSRMNFNNNKNKNFKKIIMINKKKKKTTTNDYIYIIMINNIHVLCECILKAQFEYRKPSIPQWYCKWLLKFVCIKLFECVALFVINNCDRSFKTICWPTYGIYLSECYGTLYYFRQTFFN